MIFCGDSAKKIKEIETDTIDALVTDPPAGISFMGKAWDGDKGGRDKWIAWLAEILRECKRVMKPGAHAMVWALPRTSHWTAMALEDAGFEIRDVVIHIFGSGFPKSLSVSKAIDKAAGAEREILGPRPNHRPNAAQNHPDADRSAWQDRSDGNITAPATDAAKQWDGWGTALKPASEHWILARKPLSEPTVAANVLKWGTGALNVDGCRIPGRPAPGGNGKPGQNFSDDAYDWPGVVNPPNEKGRWPSNVVLDPEAGRMLDEQSGNLESGLMKPDQLRKASKGKGGYHDGFPDRPALEGTYGDSGGASRFFYCAKPSRAERNEGLREMESKFAPTMGNGIGGKEHDPDTATKKTNVHPTVKAVELMRYLCRLITPPGGTVLDPFMGSGSTGIGAHKEDLKFIGIEKDPEYFEIAKRRIDAATAQGRMFV